MRRLPIRRLLAAAVGLYLLLTLVAYGLWPERLDPPRSTSGLGLEGELRANGAHTAEGRGDAGGRGDASRAALDQPVDRVAQAARDAAAVDGRGNGGAIGGGSGGVASANGNAADDGVRAGSAASGTGPSERASGNTKHAANAGAGTATGAASVGAERRGSLEGSGSSPLGPAANSEEEALGKVGNLADAPNVLQEGADAGGEDDRPASGVRGAAQAADTEAQPAAAKAKGSAKGAGSKKGGKKRGNAGADGAGDKADGDSKKGGKKGKGAKGSRSGGDGSGAQKDSAARAAQSMEAGSIGEDEGEGADADGSARTGVVSARANDADEGAASFAPSDCPGRHPHYRIAMIVVWLGGPPPWFAHFAASAARSSYLVDWLLFHEGALDKPVLVDAPGVDADDGAEQGGGDGHTQRGSGSKRRTPLPRNVLSIDVGENGLASKFGFGLGKALGWQGVSTRRLVGSFKVACCTPTVPLFS